MRHHCTVLHCIIINMLVDLTFAYLQRCTQGTKYYDTIQYNYVVKVKVMMIVVMMIVVMVIVVMVIVVMVRVVMVIVVLVMVLCGSLQQCTMYAMLTA